MALKKPNQTKPKNKGTRKKIPIKKVKKMYSLVIVAASY